MVLIELDIDPSKQLNINLTSFKDLMSLQMKIAADFKIDENLEKIYGLKEKS